MTDSEAVAFVRQVASGTIGLTSQEGKALGGDPNPEWFCLYGKITIKMHTNPLREGVSGIKIVDVDGERSFFNMGAVLALKGGAVGGRKATTEYTNCFAAWTGGLTWDEARTFITRILSNSLAMSPNLKRS